MANMFIKFEEPAIEGSSTVSGHEREIEVLSWSHGFAQQSSPTREGSAEHAHHANLTFTKYLDVATNTLLKLCWNGKQIGKATLSCYRGDGAKEKYLEVEMKHVIIANYSVSGGPGDIPVENIALDYGVIQYKYLGAGGEHAIAHDRINNRIT